MIFEEQCFGMNTYLTLSRLFDLKRKGKVMEVERQLSHLHRSYGFFYINTVCIRIETATTSLKHVFSSRLMSKVVTFVHTQLVLRLCSFVAVKTVTSGPRISVAPDFRRKRNRSVSSKICRSRWVG